MASTLQQWNVLADGVRIFKHRNRQEELEPFYFMEGDLAASSNVNELTVALKISYNPSELIDSSKSGLTAVLLDNGNTCHQFQWVMQCI